MVVGAGQRTPILPLTSFQVHKRFVLTGHLQSKHFCWRKSFIGLVAGSFSLENRLSAQLGVAAIGTQPKPSPQSE
jgi:Na+-transporting NADH:ubiquinone oxidoreductase subunit NqrB